MDRGMDPCVGTWTDVTSDSRLVEHLLDLYFCWEYPTLASLSREHFMADFVAGRPRFCSPLLVNALLALASRFSDRPELRTGSDPHTTGDVFFAEAQRLFWNMESHYSLTTIQAAGIMSIRQVSCGMDRESRYYAGQSVRLCVEMGLHRHHDTSGPQNDESIVQLATFWGAFALDHAWSLTAGSLPQFSQFPLFPPKITPQDGVDNALWMPYTDDGSTLQHPCEQPSHITSVFNSFCELSEIVHKSLYTLHCPARTPNRQDLIGIYTRFLSWYNSLPEPFRLGGTFTPQVLYMHVYYHYSIILTFRPFIELRITNSTLLPRKICVQAADAIHGHIRSYAELYSLRRTPSFMPYLVLMSSRLYLAVGGLSLSPEGSVSLGSGRAKAGVWANGAPDDLATTLGRVQRGIDNLDDMRQCHRVADVAWNMLRFLIEGLKAYVEITRALQGGQGRRGEFDPHWAALSVNQGADFFSPKPVGDGWDKIKMKAAEKGRASTGTSPRRMLSLLQSSDAMRSALFWPSPRLPPPSIIPVTFDLEEAGFEPIEVE
ncbi:nitrogen assimilation transcription factor nirA [Podospora aff. communis PSN243]|uniref:Nitrogen assimilation transcription factor nirA n=1 Tax=Podospora aff. communis PSN243 TaxID=3040156 RepID=A0AAV9GSV8_9PEZI|nr:nitrogen assimilation transcription factor nirA [Podospora aff. communis PSN243]